MHETCKECGAALPQPLTDTDLFNCCTGGTAPDFTQWSRLELAGCRDANAGKDTDETNTVGDISADAAEFFTVYGRQHAADGIELADAITDITDARRALAVAAELGRRSGLPVHVAASLA